MTGPFVLDTSLAMSWCFPDEATATNSQLLLDLLDTYAHVPTFFFFEVQNSLRSGELRNRISSVESEQFWQRLRRFNILMEPLRSPVDVPLLLSLSRETDLTPYDSLFVDLAIRLRLPLATLDKKMRNAALRLGVQVLP